MKIFPPLALAAAGIALMTGCSTLAAAPAPTITVTGTASDLVAAPSAEAELSKTMWDYQEGQLSDEDFVSFVRENTTTLDPYEQDMLVVLTQTTCAAVANGTTKAEILEKQVAMAQSRQNGELTRDMGRDVGYLLGVGSKNFCPELSDELVQLTNS